MSSIHLLEVTGMLTMGLSAFVIMTVPESSFDRWWWLGMVMLIGGAALLFWGQALRHRATMKRVDALTEKHERASKGH